jgi:hypothetical protein
MAILGSNFLNGCNSIPGFIGGLSDTPSNPSRTTFEQSSAPTSWTKIIDAAYNNRALRVIGGANGTSLSPGGSTAFSSIFAESKALSPFAVTQQSSNISIQNPPTSYIQIQNSSSGFSVGNSTGTLETLRVHNHPYIRAPGSFGAGAAAATQRASPNGVVNVGTSAAGSGGQHSHGIAGQHSHPASAGGHIHPVTITQHGHTFTMTSRNFNLLYVDIIVCQKS